MKSLLRLTVLFFICTAITVNAQPVYDWHHDTYDAITSRSVTAKNIAAGDSDYVYVAGQSNRGVDFDFNMGVAQLSDTLHLNAYVAVYTTAGVYARSWCLEQTGSGTSQIGDLCIAGNGDVLITGYFSGSVDFSPGPTSTIITAGAGDGDSYIARFSKLGQLLWVRTFAPTTGTWVQTLCIKETSNKIVVGGMFYAPASTPVDLNPEAGVSNHFATHCAEGFVVNFSANGTFGWSIANIGASVQGIDMNATGNIAVTGQVVIQTDFDPGPNTAPYTAVCTGPCMGDFFVARYDANGNYQWHFAVGNWYEGVGFDVQLMPTNEIYVIGYCGGLIDLDGGIGSTYVNNSGNFCAKYNSNGTLAWGWDGGAALDIDALGNTYLLDHNGTHCISPAGISYWDIPVGMSSYGGSIGLSQNGKILMAWQSGVTEDVDPGPATININSPLTAAHPIHLSLIAPTTGIEESNTSQVVTVHPNPATTFLVLTQTAVQEQSYTIFNTTGEAVLNGTFTSEQEQINIAALPNGAYFLRTDGHPNAIRFIVCR